MAEEILAVAVVDENGKLDPGVFPITPPPGYGGSSGGGGGGGGPQCFTWHFPGELVVQSGKARYIVPGGLTGSTVPYDGSFTPIVLTADLGTVGTDTSGAIVRGTLMANGSPVATITLQSGWDSAAIDMSAVDFTRNDRLSFDITVVTNVTPVKPGDLTIALWWMWS